VLDVAGQDVAEACEAVVGESRCAHRTVVTLPRFTNHRFRATTLAQVVVVDVAPKWHVLLK